MLNLTKNILSLLCLLALAACAPEPAFAAESSAPAKVCNNYYDVVLAQQSDPQLIAAQREHGLALTVIEVLPEDFAVVEAEFQSKTATDLSKATRIFIIHATEVKGVGEQYVGGFEVDGCLLPPLYDIIREPYKPGSNA